MRRERAHENAVQVALAERGQVARIQLERSTGLAYREQAALPNQDGGIRWVLPVTEEQLANRPAERRVIASVEGSPSPLFALEPGRANHSNAARRRAIGYGDRGDRPVTVEPVAVSHARAFDLPDTVSVERSVDIRRDFPFDTERLEVVLLRKVLKPASPRRR